MYFYFSLDPRYNAWNNLISVEYNQCIQFFIGTITITIVCIILLSVK